VSRNEDFAQGRTGPIRFEHAEHAGEESTHRLAAWFDGDDAYPIAGYIRHTPHDKGTKVDMVHVDEGRRRRGVASALMGELERMYGSENIQHTERTDEGQSWWRKYRGGS
jgi:ribosomal protein S18 acetylase RimI-like enzyme